DFPHRAPTFGLRASESPIGPGVDDTRVRKRIASVEMLVLADRPPRALVPPLKLAVPTLLHLSMELGKRSVVGGHAVVVVVPADDRAEPPMLLPQWLMHSSSHFFAQDEHLRCALLPGGTAHQHESPQSRLRRDVRESKEVERLGPRAPVAFAVLAGVAPKPKH